jgi:uncharacterized protein (DUF433 family)
MSNMIELPGSPDEQLSPPQEQGVMETTAEAPIQQDPEKLGGHPTIGSKRVQADVLINYLASGATIHDFLADYDAVTEEEVRAALSVIRQAILDGMLTGVRVRDENTF